MIRLPSERGPDEDRVLDPARLAAVRATGLSTTDDDELFDDLVRAAARVLSVPCAFVSLVDDDRSLRQGWFGVDPSCMSEGVEGVANSLCELVVRGNGPVLVSDVSSSLLDTCGDLSAGGASVRAWAAWAAWPIRSVDGHVVGTFCALDVVERQWCGQDEELLSLFAGAAENVLTLRTNAATAESIAQRLRSSLLPPALPDFPGLDVAALHRSATGPGRVLGDFYDMFLSSRGRWHVLLGDVCGHGIEAASVAAMARWSYHALAEVDDEPEAIFPRMNAVLSRQTEGRFLSMQALSFTGLGDDRSLSLRFASAGHHPAVIRRCDGTVEEVTANGWLLGAFDAVRVGCTDLVLGVGDQLVLFTDGLIEARGPAGVIGGDGVVAHVAALRPSPAATVASSLVDLADTISEGALRDDIAVLVLGVLPP